MRLSGQPQTWSDVLSERRRTELKELRRPPDLGRITNSGALDETEPINRSTEVLLVQRKPRKSFCRSLQLKKRELLREELKDYRPTLDPPPQTSEYSCQNSPMIEGHGPAPIWQRVLSDALVTAKVIPRGLERETRFIQKLIALQNPVTAPGRAPKPESLFDAGSVPLLIRQVRHSFGPSTDSRAELAERFRRATSPVLPRQEVIDGLPLHTGNGSNRRFQNQRQVSDRNNSWAALLLPGIAPFVSKGVDLLGISEFEAGLFTNPIPQAALESSVLLQVDRTERNSALVMWAANREQSWLFVRDRNDDGVEPDHQLGFAFRHARTKHKGLPRIRVLASQSSASALLL